jgi:hypothetical protein
MDDKNLLLQDQQIESQTADQYAAALTAITISVTDPKPPSMVKTVLFFIGTILAIIIIVTVCVAFPPSTGALAPAAFYGILGTSTVAGLSSLTGGIYSRCRYLADSKTFPEVQETATFAKNADTLAKSLESGLIYNSNGSSSIANRDKLSEMLIPLIEYLNEAILGYYNYDKDDILEEVNGMFSPNFVTQSTYKKFMSFALRYIEEHSDLDIKNLKSFMVKVKEKDENTIKNLPEKLQESGKECEIMLLATIKIVARLMGFVEPQPKIRATSAEDAPK